MGIKFGINALCYPDTPDIVKLAEEKRFDLATIVEGQLLWRDVYSCLTICAIKTSRILLGPGMTNPVTRHPSVTAGAIATLNELSKGRAVLGIGRGNNALVTIGLSKASSETLIEHVEAVKAYLLQKTGVAYHGGESTVPLWGKSKVPILVAAQGPRMLEVAGQIADGVVILGPPEPSMLRWAVDRIKAGARKEKGSAPEIHLYTHCYVSSDIEKAREMCKGPVSAAYNIFAAESTLKTEQLPVELSSRLQRVRNEMSYDFQKHLRVGAAHSRALTDEDIDLWSIIGPPDGVIDKFSRLKELGISNFLLSVPWDTHELRQFLDTFSDSVISYFR